MLTGALPVQYALPSNLLYFILIAGILKMDQTGVPQIFEHYNCNILVLPSNSDYISYK